jgi:hypothetical protein
LWLFMRALIAVALANLPLRWWKPFEERFPLLEYAWVSGILTLMAGFAVGIPGFLNFVRAVAGGVNQALIDSQSDLVQIPGWGLLSLPIYLLTTPSGLLSLYLVVSGLARFATAYIADDPHGDLILSGLDGLWVRTRRRTADWDQRKTREKLEGPVAPDRLVTGDWLGRADVEIAVLAARRKDWPRGSYLVTDSGQAYRVGEPFDITTRTGLRAAYPLTELKTGEAIRHAFPYELPPLWKQPRDGV